MRILHTADWHLGDRLGRIDRTDDLRRSVERIADYCSVESIDTLLVAGDIFSELARADGLRDAIRHLQTTFGKFLHDGGSILAITGNHDNENFCQTLWHAMTLASPAASMDGNRAAPGRLHLATSPQLLRLADPREGFDAQFVLMPFPTPNVYLNDQPGLRYGSLDERNRNLVGAFARKLHGVLDDPSFVKESPSVLAAHLSVVGGELSNRFRLAEQEDLVLRSDAIPTEFAYVALGHIHKPQSLGGNAHIRYSGSIERLDLGEKNDTKSVVVFDLGPNGIRGEPVSLPLTATPIYEVDIIEPSQQLPSLAQRYADSQNDLVNIHIAYTAGVDQLENVLQQVEKIFPRWYARDWKEVGMLGQTLTVDDADRSRSFPETVRNYLTGELANHDEAERAAILERAETLIQQMD